LLLLAAFVWGPAATYGSIIPLVGVTGTRLVFYLNNVGCFFSWLDSAQKLRAWQLKEQAALLPLLLRFLPIAAHIAGILLWAARAPSVILGAWLVPFWILHGLGSSFLTVDIMVQRITKQSFPGLRSAFVAVLPLAGAAASYATPAHDAEVLLALLGISTLVYLRYWFSVVWQLARHLRINVFTLGKRLKED